MYIVRDACSVVCGYEERRATEEIENVPAMSDERDRSSWARRMCNEIAEVNRSPRSIRLAAGGKGRKAGRVGR